MKKFRRLRPPRARNPRCVMNAARSRARSPFCVMRPARNRAPNPFCVMRPARNRARNPFCVMRPARNRAPNPRCVTDPARNRAPNRVLRCGESSLVRLPGKKTLCGWSVPCAQPVWILLMSGTKGLCGLSLPVLKTAGWKTSSTRCRRPASGIISSAGNAESWQKVGLRRKIFASQGRANPHALGAQIFPPLSIQQKLYRRHGRECGGGKDHLGQLSDVAFNTVAVKAEIFA